MKTRIFITAFILVALLAACAPMAVATSAPVAAGNEVKISGFAFNPGTLTIKVGQTVTWINQDSAAHTVVADDGSFKSGSLAQGDSFSHTFDAAGSFTYKCGVHPTMLGTVVVQP